MPRIPNSLIRYAYAINPVLMRLLPVCRTLDSARNELRWLREHVTSLPVKSSSHVSKRPIRKAAHLRRLIEQRVRGVPLQYVLGTEYFGDLEIGCQKGVLIPRQDTATATLHLSSLFHRSAVLPSQVHILDLCTGTGCIPLLLVHELGKSRSSGGRVRVNAVGVDVSKTALSLARRNVAQYGKALEKMGSTVTIIRANVLASLHTTAPLIQPQALIQSPTPPDILTALHTNALPRKFDILTANPPYISPHAFRTTTARSVRHHEPRLALVPPPPLPCVPKHPSESVADAFYAPILRVAGEVKAKVVLLEVADWAQAVRVVGLIRELGRNEEGEWDGVEIWRDEMVGEREGEVMEGAWESVRVKGRGEARVVVCWKGVGGEWVGKNEKNTAKPIIT